MDFLLGKKRKEENSEREKGNEIKRKPGARRFYVSY
jgi:hypothetical protein